jgi:hypothetical protein
MQLGIVIENLAVYFVLVEKRKCFLKKRILLKNKDYLSIILQGLKEFSAHSKAQKTSLHIVVNQELFSAWNKECEHKLKLELKKQFSLDCFFCAPIESLGAMALENSLFCEKSTVIMDLESLEGLFFLEENRITKCSLAKWIIGEDKKGQKKQMQDYLQEKLEMPRYQKLLIIIVNLYDPYKIIFFTQKKKEINAFFSHNDELYFHNKLKTKIEVLEQDFYQLAHFACLSKK